MGLFDELKRLTRPYDDDEDDFLDEADDFEEAPSQEKPKMNPFAGFSFGGEKTETESKIPSPVRPGSSKPGGKVVNLAGGNSAMQMVLAKPDRFEAAVEIADHLRDRRAVLMNLETTPKDTARRLIDFLSGVAYAMGGKIKKVSANTYIITPSSVNLMGELMDELESTSFYF
ncbi:MAG: cell division protein SepF [Ruminococcaceae bacterium]|nr:cell division protein SepF [Oscillospiraceae bacterium]